MDASSHLEDKYYEPIDFMHMFIKGPLFQCYLIYYTGWVYGIIIYQVVWYVLYFILKKKKGFERLSALDEFFLLDSPKNRANVITVVKLEKTPDYDAIRQKVIDLAIKKPRLHHKLTKEMGEYFFEAMDKEELEAAVKKHFIRNDSIKNDDDIAKFLAREQAVRDPLDTLQYKFFYTPDFSATESLLIFKFHHSMSDGISTMVITGSLNDSGYNPE